MLKKYFNVLCALMINIVSATVFADVATSGFQLSVYSGIAYTNIDASSYTLQGNQIEELDPTDNSFNFAWGIGIAYHYILPKYLHDISIGFDMFRLTSVQKGDVLDYGTLNNSTYKLKFESRRLMANSELTFYPIGQWLYPFIEIGIGFTVNNTDYDNTPDPNAAWEVGQSMSSNNNFQFAYNLGGGLKIVLPHKMQLSFRYLYAGLGSAVTEESTASLSTIKGIDTPVHSQTWLAGLSYQL